MRWRVVAALLLLPGLLQACGGNSSVTPTPPPTSPTLVSVTITGSLSVYAGLTTQLKATANYAKGTPLDVTNQATWASATPAVATISPSGILKGVSTGTADITASYQNVTGTLHVTVNRVPLYTLSGTVTETFPTASTAVAGVVVQVVDGANQGQSATTDSSGQYQLTDLVAGTFSVKAHHDNYDDVTSSVTIQNDATLAFSLNPTSKEVREVFDSNVSGGGPSTCQLQGGTTPFPCRVFPLALHNTGPLAAALGWATTDEAIFVLQLYNDDTDQVVSQSPVTPSDTNTSTLLTLNATMSAAGNYQLRVIAWRISSTVSFELITTHPN